jgi:hypothetical protein
LRATVCVCTYTRYRAHSRATTTSLGIETLLRQDVTNRNTLRRGEIDQENSIDKIGIEKDEVFIADIRSEYHCFFPPNNEKITFNQ